VSVPPEPEAASVSAAAVRHYHGPDLLRLVAACLVVLFHLSETGGASPSWPVAPGEAPLGWLAPIAWMGWVGVPMFFVLSGFLIAASAVNSTPIGFLRKRAIRIFPALWISCLIALACRALWGEPLGALVPAFIRSAVLWPKGPYIDGVVWSLVVEAVFYLVVCIAIQRSGSADRVRRGLVWTAIVIGLASTAFTLIRWGLAGWEPANSLLGSFAFDLLLLRQGMFFAIGMLLFHLLDKSMTRPLAAALSLFTGAACLQIADTTANTGDPLVPILIWSVSSALMFFSVRRSGRRSSNPWTAATRELGLMTYPLYLNHFVLSQALLPVMMQWLPGKAVFPILFALLLGNAWLIARFPEKWLQRRIKSLWSETPPATVRRVLNKASV
jgi:peptidoglycan/LPS O-acetylase OafA/YrhL